MPTLPVVFSQLADRLLSNGAALQSRYFVKKLGINVKGWSAQLLAFYA